MIYIYYLLSIAQYFKKILLHTLEVCGLYNFDQRVGGTGLQIITNDAILKILLARLSLFQSVVVSLT